MDQKGVEKMKKVKKLTMICLLILMSLLIVSCQEETFHNPPDFCLNDNDCIPTGCSQTICASKNDEIVFTTCEYRYEYACYQDENLANCICVENKCQWRTLPGFDECMSEKTKLNDGVPIV